VVELSVGVERIGSGRAGLHTGSAAAAAIRKEHELRLYALGFRVTTPQATQGAALEEDGGAYARTVLQREALDIIDSTVFHGSSSE
jgi:hypothetical protein